ncbi:MAG: ABC transporter permease [Phycisphaerae bacterium]
MQYAIIKLMSAVLGVGNFTGPVLAKELRVSARRKRNYVLRAGYVAALLGFIALIWVSEISRRLEYAQQGSELRIVEQMSRAGREIVLCIVWFQFIVAQAVAVILASASISEESRNRTLGVLMTTPVSAFQIVMGKVLSKLLQVMVLLALSLPLLAWVRIFGGVPWDFVVAGLCITICAVVFAGSLSTFFSIFSRRTYVVILESLAALAFIYAFLPWAALMSRHTIGISGSRTEVLIRNVHPFGAMAACTDEMMYPGGRTAFFWWPTTCIVLLAGTALVLLVCCIFVRRVALRQAAGGPASSGPAVPDVMMLYPPGVAPMRAVPRGRRIREVTGSPILWKELRTGLFRRKLWLFIIGGAAMGLLLVTYAFCAIDHDLDDRDVHVVYCVILLLAGMLVTAVVAATPITSEKESRSWPLLLLTDLSDWHILAAKALGVIRRSAIVWAPLGFHLLLFAALRLIHPVAVFHTILIVGWTALFLTAGGLFFSSLFRKTTTAVIMNLVLAVFLWLALPFATYCLERACGADKNCTAAMLYSNPVVQDVVIMEAASGHRAERDLWDLSYHWPYGYRHRYMGFAETAVGATLVIVFWGTMHLALALILLLLAKARLRKNPG